MMGLDVTPALVNYLARNRSLVPGDPEARLPAQYGFSASLDGGAINMALTFQAGVAYCCSEAVCHLSLGQNERWESLRRELAACGATLPNRLELRLTVSVEPGALFFDIRRPEPSPRGRGWYAFAPANGYQSQVVLTEDGEAIAPDPR